MLSLDHYDLSSLDVLEQLHYTFVGTTELLPAFEQAYKRSKQSKNEGDRARSAFLLGAYYEDKDIETTTVYYQEAHRIAQKIGDERILSDTLHGIAIPLLLNGQYEKANELELQAIALARKTDHIFRIAFTQYILASIATSYGAYEAGIDHLQKSFSLSNQEGYLKLQVSIHDKLSELYLIVGEYSKARLQAEASLRVGKELNISINRRLRTYIRLATIFIETEKIDQASELIEFVFSLADTIDKSLLSNAYTIQGQILRHQRKYKRAEEIFGTALTVIKGLNKYRIESNIFSHIAQLYDQKRDMAAALKYALKAYKLAKISNDIYVAKESLKLLYEYNKKLRKPKEALSFLEKYNEKARVSENALLKNRLEYYELKSEFERKQAEIDEEKKKAEMLRLELEQKERELTEKTRHLIKQTEAVAQFRDDLRAILRRTPGDDPLVKDVKDRLKSFPEEQLNWIEFDKLFDSVHPEFYSNIVKAFPKLTIMERKICILLRLKLTSTDISKLLFLSDRNIENHRYRIRKKLGLNTEDSIHEFLAKF
jgi:DNA-binding CsgD family transcriptional regulator